MKKIGPPSLDIPPVVPFASNHWHFGELVSEETRAELVESFRQLDQSRTLDKEIIGFQPPID